MIITYTDQKDFSVNDLEQLFKSVDWLSGNYADRLKKALVKYYKQNGFEHIDGRYVFAVQNG